MRFNVFLMVAILVAAVFVGWRYVPADHRNVVKTNVRRHWWVLVLVICVMFAMAALNSTVSWRIF